VGSFILFLVTMKLISFKTKKSWPPYNDTFWTKSRHWEKVPAKARKPGNKILGLLERWHVIQVQYKTLPKGNNKKKKKSNLIF
jgi:transcription initiation factor TFIID subunit TAF12